MYFVISMVAGLILTVYCGCLFVIDLKKSAQVNLEYQQNVVRLNQLMIRPLFPSEANITRAKDDRSRLEAFRDEVRTNFARFPTPPKEDEKGFSTYLEDTIAGLQAKAEADAVILPTNMSFGFTDQRGKLNFHAECIQPWMQQLTEIKALCDILFSAKINSLASFRRVPVSSNDVFLTPPDYLASKIMTNGLETITPYKIEFRCFTRELAAVMKGLAESDNCYVVNNIVVRLAGPREGEQIQSSSDQTPAPTPPIQTLPPARRGGTTTPPRRGTTTAPGTSPVTPPAPNPPTRGRGTRRGAAAGMGGMEGMAGLEPAAPILVGAAAAPMPAMPGMPPVPPARGAAPAAPAGGRPPAAGSGTAASGPPGAGSYAPGTVLREQLLLIMISVEVIRFN